MRDLVNHIKEDKDIFRPISSEEQIARREEYKKMLPQNYYEMGRSAGMGMRMAQMFDKYMTMRWGKRELNTSYGDEWANRFMTHRAWDASDSKGREVLKQIGYDVHFLDEAVSNLWWSCRECGRKWMWPAFELGEPDNCPKCKSEDIGKERIVEEDIFKPATKKEIEGRRVFEPEELYQRWSNGKPITYKGKQYRVGKMGLGGSYFLEPWDPKHPLGRGEQYPLADGTLWIKWFDKGLYKVIENIKEADIFKAASRNEIFKRKGIDTRLIGSGKLPNRYYVMAGNDYYVMVKKGQLDWASDYGLIKNFKDFIELSRAFDTYKEAREYADSLASDFPEIPTEDTPNTVTIEDHLSGELYHVGVVGKKRKHPYDYSVDDYESTRFTKEKMEEEGYVFECAHFILEDKEKDEYENAQLRHKLFNKWYFELHKDEIMNRLEKDKKAKEVNEEEEEIFKPASPEEIAARQESRMFKSLNDAYPIGDTEIWYWKSLGHGDERGPEVDFLMGVKWCRERKCLPDPNDLSRTHVLLGKVAQTDIDRLYSDFQGEVWSPNGEARSMIKRLGLGHTSMSVGDIIKIGDKVWMVDTQGFVDLNNEYNKQ